MNELISRWSKKSLSTIITLLNGIILLIFILNKYTVVNIKTDYFNFITIDNTNPSILELLIFWLILYSNLIFIIIKKFIYNHVSDKILNKELIEKELHTKLLTFDCIFELLSSISGFLLLFILPRYNSTNHILFFFFSTILYIWIIAQICIAVYHHFYSKSASIVNKFFENKE